MMSYSGFEQEETKKRWLPKAICKLSICRPGSPKFWQLIHNDIPLLLAIPVALIFDLIDPYTALFAAIITIVDSISMLTYLSHEDLTGVEATIVYELVSQSRQ